MHIAPYARLDNMPDFLRSGHILFGRQKMYQFLAVIELVEINCFWKIYLVLFEHVRILYEVYPPVLL